MKRTITIVILFSLSILSCKKESVTTISQDCKQTPPAKCMTIRCTSDGKPVCGCNGVTYGSACEAECNGVVSYTYGNCKN
ncbi:MAG: kazal domain protein [Bacteroidota bacterium]|nr:kazal domain protein [Bacteroidota bacterium]